MQNYDKFVAGIDEVSRVEQDLVAAHKTAKVIAKHECKHLWCSLQFTALHCRLLSMTQTSMLIVMQRTPFAGCTGHSGIWRC